MKATLEAQEVSRERYSLAAGSNIADMTPEHLRSLLDRQRTAFMAEGAPAYETRIDRTNRLIALLVDNQDKIVSALNADYGHRSAEASLLTDVWSVIDNYKYTKLHLREWMQTEIHEAMFADAEARVEYVPKGVVGVVGSWNFPWRLAFAPIGYVFAAGNRCMLKPSELTPATSALMAELAAKYFDETELTVVQGGPDIGAAFTALPFDHLIFTGSAKVGSAVMRAAVREFDACNLGTRRQVTRAHREVGGHWRRRTKNSYREDLQCWTDLPRAGLRAFAQWTRTTIRRGGKICGGIHVPETPRAIRTIPPSSTNGTSIASRDWIADAESKGAEVIELNPASEDLSDVASHRIAPTLLLKGHRCDDGTPGRDFRPGAADRHLRNDRRGNCIHKQAHSPARVVLLFT